MPISSLDPTFTVLQAHIRAGGLKALKSLWGLSEHVLTPEPKDYLKPWCLVRSMKVDPLSCNAEPN